MVFTVFQSWLRCSSKCAWFQDGDGFGVEYCRFHGSVSFLQVMPSQITNPGDAEEKRHSCHRVDCVTLDSAHHCLAPKHHSSTPRHPQGYVHDTPVSNTKWLLKCITALQGLDNMQFIIHDHQLHWIILTPVIVSLISVDYTGWTLFIRIFV